LIECEVGQECLFYSSCVWDFGTRDFDKDRDKELYNISNKGTVVAVNCQVNECKNLTLQRNKVSL
jgi:hypothetical protein